MKYLILSTLLSCAAFAQGLEFPPPDYSPEIKGVFLGGTPEEPLLVNESAKPVIGYTVLRWDAEGNQLSADRILLVDELSKAEPGIKAGQTEPHSLGNKINFKSRGVAARVELDTVLFADGEVVGPDSMAPEYPAINMFQHQLEEARSEARPGLIKVPKLHTPGNTITPHHNFDPREIYILQCSNTGSCWPIVYYSGDQSFVKTYYGTSYGIETSSVGGTAVCGPGSPQQGYGIGDNVSATIFCPVSTVYAQSFENSQRMDLQPDRIVQTMSIYNAYNNNIQNSAKFHELCAYAILPNRGGQGPFGKAVVEYNRKYGC